MGFKRAAREVLREIGHPLHYRDITDLAMDAGYLESSGRTPHDTMRARLSVDVRDNPQSPFTRTAPGVFGLKEWSAEDNVY
ncbi:MAG: winged helix-turn-helix domain-containing protein [Rubrobacteraceae bacterium]|uniref:winged helix-turn-helix domain-containing protein n=1 Tax=Rubrobacter naiadicus TaxID=1392641 RepID=UPI00235F0541|nr:winged helix-turn-helix domain-containing protein [Rubrobacter naiadicus]MBX6762713.1 winged helix-turn-helix domain-containing protein [Rubrobacteraceae bacterium]MCL6439365.1 winged helix-turn-helix domain-containing protein [Rubrobacteraceae bacterium]